jgi:hypothetical protein
MSCSNIITNPSYDFDRYLKYDELKLWLNDIAKLNPNLIELSTYGKSNEDRDLFIVSVSDLSFGESSSKPAHFIDANIHSIEVTAGVAACYLIHYLLNGYYTNDNKIKNALKTRTFYIVPRVNPDGVEAALSENPTYVRSSMKMWPYKDGHRWPGMFPQDLDGDGRILTMRVKDDNGAWVSHPDDDRVMIPVDNDLSPISKGKDCNRYRLLKEGLIDNYDGFTIPLPRNRQGLDLNRNFPAGWGKAVKGSGDHAMSEPEVEYLVKAISARPNICGYNAFHTNGGILIRPSSTRCDDDLSQNDVWVWKEMGKIGTELTGSHVHSCYEDFTWDKKEGLMSGAGDDFAYDHLGVFGWTTEFWDVVAAATGQRASTKIWYVGNSVEENLSIAKWADANAPGSYVTWYEFNHPQLGLVELGGPDEFNLMINPPKHLLLKEVAPHAEFAVHQALLSPKLEILLLSAEEMSNYNNTNDELFVWKIKIGLANTGFLPTNVSDMALKISAVLPIRLEITSEYPLKSFDGYSPLCVRLGQLNGRLSSRIEWYNILSFIN